MDKQEKDIVKSIRKGEKSAFELVFKKHFVELCDHARRYISDLDEAKDIVQYTFVKFWEIKESISIDTSVRSYLYRAVQNNCLTYLRHEKVKEDYRKLSIDKSTEDDISDISNSGVNLLISSELENKIKSSINHLPEGQRQIFEMSRFQGLKYREIATKLDISIKTVETQMSRCLSKLREELVDYIPYILLLIGIKDYI